jgi:hypothetical protein
MREGGVDGQAGRQHMAGGFGGGLQRLQGGAVASWPLPGVLK